MTHRQRLILGSLILVVIALFAALIYVLLTAPIGTSASLSPPPETYSAPVAAVTARSAYAVAWEATVVRQAVHDLVQCLPEPLRVVVVARYGLGGRAPSIYRQIGAALGVSGERARQLHTEALVWLRHPAHSQNLRSLLGRHTLADYQAADALAQHWLRRRGGRHDR